MANTKAAHGEIFDISLSITFLSEAYLPAWEFLTTDNEISVWKDELVELKLEQLQQEVGGPMAGVDPD